MTPLLLLAALLSQAPTPTPAQPPPADGLIIGRVVDGTTGKPVTGVVVTLTARTPPNTPPAPPRDLTPPPPPPRVLVDASGRFIFTRLTPGFYEFSATRRGYVSGSFGKLRVEGSGQPMTLTASERRMDVMIRVWKHASMSGTLLDEMNEPVVGVTVNALRREWVAGEMRFVQATGAQTDDRGRYRIGSLLPGDYVISVPSTQTTVAPASMTDDPASVAPARMIGTANGPIPLAPLAGSRETQRIGDLMMQGAPWGVVQPAPAADGKVSVYPTAYFPAAPDAGNTATATSVSIVAGESKIVPPIHLRPVPAVRVSGVLTKPDGPAAFTQVVLVAQAADALSSEVGFEAARTTTDAAGVFTLLGVTPGTYRIRAYTSPPTALGPVKVESMPPLPQPPMFWLNDIVTVGSRDVTVTLALKSALTLSGRLVFEGQKAPPPASQLSREVLTYVSADGRQINRLTSRYVGAADGSFNFFDVPGGRTILTLYQPPSGWYLRSITVNGQDAIDAPIDLTDDVSGIVATFTDRPTNFKGIVRSPAGLADAETVVLIFPSNPQRWIGSGRSPLRFRGARPDATGAFSVTGLVPGDYFVAAIPEAAASNWQSPKFLETISRQATRLTLTEGAPIVQDIKRLDVK